MKFEDISDDIMHHRNYYEEKRGIKTLKVKPWRKIDEQNWIFKGYKREEKGVTITLFLALKKGKLKDEWCWVCPSKTAWGLLPKTKTSYHYIDKLNSKIRKGKENIEGELDENR